MHVIACNQMWSLLLVSYDSAHNLFEPTNMSDEPMRPVWSVGVVRYIVFDDCMEFGLTWCTFQTHHVIIIIPVHYRSNKANQNHNKQYYYHHHCNNSLIYQIECYKIYCQLLLSRLRSLKLNENYWVRNTVMAMRHSFHVMPSVSYLLPIC